MSEDIWANILSYLADLRTLPRLASIGRIFPERVKSKTTWHGLAMRICPKTLPSFAPHLDKWLPALRSASKLLVPRSQQLLAKLSESLPAGNIEVFWRFHRYFKGSGIKGINSGLTVQ